MKSLLYLILLSLSILCSESVVGQSKLPEKLDFQPTLFSYRLKKGPVNVGRSRANVLMKDCPAALKNYNNGNSTLAVSTIFQLLGTVALIGYGTDYYFNDKSSPQYLVLGGVLLTASIPLNISGKRQVGTGVGKYNIQCLKQ